MGKLKTGVVLLMAAMMIAVLAWMPQTVSGVSDIIGNKKPGTAPMQSVELALSSDRMEEPGYMMRKLALEHGMNTVPILPEQATLTEEEAIHAAMDGMMVYVEAKLFEWFEYELVDAQPYLGVDPEDKSNNSIIWGVNFFKKGEPYNNLFLHVDDETGKIIFISYETYGEDQNRYYDPEDRRLMMEGFVDSFLGPLNLTQLSEYENLDSECVPEMLSPKEVSVRYTFEDAHYGIINLEFVIYPFGFYVIFPDS